MNNDTTSMYSRDCGDMRLRYDKNGECISMSLLPLACLGQVCEPRPNIGATADAKLASRFVGVPLRRPEPLIQIRRAGDAYGDGHDPGRTLRYCASTGALQFRDLREESVGNDGFHTTIQLGTEDGLLAEHHVSWQSTWQALRVWTEVVNEGGDEISLELVTSFSLGGLTPFCADDAPGRLYIHRFRSGWSSENRHERILAKHLGLERAWAPFSLTLDNATPESPWACPTRECQPVCSR